MRRGWGAYILTLILEEAVAKEVMSKTIGAFISFFLCSGMMLAFLCLAACQRSYCIKNYIINNNIAILELIIHPY